MTIGTTPANKHNQALYLALLHRQYLITPPPRPGCLDGFLKRIKCMRPPSDCSYTPILRNNIRGLVYLLILYHDVFS